MQYYSAIKKNEILSFAEKWLEVDRYVEQDKAISKE
jgi:hypothetical protein